MAILALPLIFGATREALEPVADRMREASLRARQDPRATIRRVLLPAIRPSIASGVVLGMGRIIGDTAIITILLGGDAHDRTRRQRAACSARCAAPARR